MKFSYIMVLFVLFILCLFPSVAKATDIQVQGMVIPNWQSKTTPAFLRIKNDAFIDNNGVFRIATSVDISVTVNTVAKTLTIPAITLTSTTDSLDNQNARYNATIVDSRGTKILALQGLDNFSIPPEIASISGCVPQGTCASWVDLRLFNNIPVPFLDRYTYTDRIINQMISQNNGGGNLNAILDFTYLLKTPTNAFPNSFAISNLGQGFIKHTGSGNLGVAVAGTDYEFPLTFASPLVRTGNALTFNTSVLSIGWNQISGVPSVFTPSEHTHTAFDIVSGIISTSRLGTGTANSGTFLRGDGTWQVVSAGVGTWGTIIGDPSNQTDLIALFDSKVPTTRTITTSSPVNGGGFLSSNINIGLNPLVNADVAVGANISYAKLALTNSIANSDLVGNIAYSKLLLNGSILNSDLSGSIADSKLLTISTAGKVSDSALSANIPLKNSANVFTQDFTVNTKITTGNFSVGTMAQKFTYDTGSTDVLIGQASMFLEPTFSFTNSLNFRTVGIMVKPQAFGSTTGGTAVFYTPYNSVMGTSISPIPLGTKGQIGGFEANIDTAQASADEAANETGHGFGTTIVTRGGAPVSAIDAILTVNTTPVTVTGVKGFNFALVNNVSGSIGYGTHIESAGTFPGSAAHEIVGTWDKGIDMSNATISTATMLFKNNTAMAWRNAANSATIPSIALNSNDNLEVFVNIVNQIANPYFQVGSNASGWLFQKVDATNSLRFFKQGAGEAFSFDANLNSVQGTAALATNATNGFFYLESMAGTPSGAPTSYIGRVPIVVDTTNSKLKGFFSGAWIDLTASPGGSSMHVQYNNSGSFAGDANFAWDNSTATLLVNGIFRANSVWTASATKTTTYTATLNDSIILCNGTFTLSLPDAATCLVSGRSIEYKIKNIGVGMITIDPNGLQNIEGTTTKILAAGVSATISTDGAAWYIF